MHNLPYVSYQLVVIFKSLCRNQTLNVGFRYVELGHMIIEILHEHLSLTMDKFELILAFFYYFLNGFFETNVFTELF